MVEHALHPTEAHYVPSPTSYAYSTAPTSLHLQQLPITSYTSLFSLYFLPLPITAVVQTEDGRLDARILLELMGVPPILRLVIPLAPVVANTVLFVDHGL